MMRKLFLVFLLINSALAQKASKAAVKATKKPWLTLNGDEPVVVANGGFSGLFPDSSTDAYSFAQKLSIPDVVLFCNLQITKDNFGICQAQFKLDNSTSIPFIFPKGEKTYNINGQEIHGWFALDHELQTLLDNVTLNQNIFSRTSRLDGEYGMATPDDIGKLETPSRLWLNIEYDMFYAQYKLSPARYIQESAQYWTASYISSPEIGFLKAMGAKVNKAKTKLIFKFLSADAVEPTTKEKYGSLLTKLSTIKSFASGILVPKQYIWPVTKDMYLEPATTLVTDAHKAGLEVYASGFANDIVSSYNYSYDPVTEYLHFIDNSQFSVDGMITDFPSSASESIGCYALKPKTATKIMNSLVISHNGASGDYPGCTDLAYQKAIGDGADIIDCSVQMSKDGVAFCFGGADLAGKTTASVSFLDRSVTVPEIQPKDGIFSFDLTWTEIQSLKPVIVNPFPGSGLLRNPANKNKGKFTTLSEFLNLAKKDKTVGVLINIENAAYLASKKGLGIVDAVSGALINATLDKQSTQKVLIQSDDSSVLSKFKDVPTYQRVLSLKEDISDAPKQVVEEIKKYADAVSITKYSIIQQDAGYFTTAATKVVEEFHAANLSVYAETLKNEYAFLAFDYFADPYVELSTLVKSKKVDGVVTDFPATASRYMSIVFGNMESIFGNPCGADSDFSIRPVIAGSMLEVIPPDAGAPASAPIPPLKKADVIDPPLPAVANIPAASDNSTATPAASPPTKSSSPKNATANVGTSIVAMMLLALLAIIY